MLNSFSGIGRLGNDPEARTNNGTMIATFDIAINEFYKKDNELQKRTHWIPCVCFGRLAEIVKEFLSKGAQVAVRGPLQLNQWSAEKGQSLTKLEVHVQELEFLSARPSQEPITQ
jgi:single-strand DNA-binding protein